ncbi:MAG TPA: TetR/AcrR family transcriptional regulator [Acidobacteriota bacterium]|nr:TetR/AcrR family transcriptional regulator [Acidobacteriota bacterium]
MRQIAQREDIRDLILDGVDVLLARYGYRKMTMEDLARQVGIGKGTLYLHFDSKEEVTLSHIDRIIERLVSQLQLIANESSTAEERIKKMLTARVLYRFDSVRGYSQSLNDLLSSLRAGLLLHRERHFENEASVFAAVLEEGKTSGSFSFPDTETAAHTLIWATNSLLPYSLSPKELGKRKEIERQVSSIADLLLSGLVARPGNRAKQGSVKLVQ